MRGHGTQKEDLVITEGATRELRGLLGELQELRTVYGALQQDFLTLQGRAYANNLQQTLETLEDATAWRNTTQKVAAMLTIVEQNDAMRRAVNTQQRDLFGPMEARLGAIGARLDALFRLPPPPPEASTENVLRRLAPWRAVEAERASLLTPAQQRLDSADVLYASALLPHLEALRHRSYHPNLVLWDTRGDRRWSWRPPIYLALYTATVLGNFLQAGPAIQRFTMLHILLAMGFGTADLNAMAMRLDDAFYQRVLADPALSFLADDHAPKLSVYRGAVWADLLTLHAGGVDRGALWDAAVSRAAQPVPHAALMYEPPSTVLAALRRHHHATGTAQRWWVNAEMADLPSRDRAFRALIRETAAADVLATTATFEGLRAWPVCLRRLAVLHVQREVLAAHVVPVSAALLDAVGAPEPVAPVRAFLAWLRGLRGEAEEAVEEEEEEATLLMRYFPAGGVGLLADTVLPDPDVTAELDDAALQAFGAQRWGPVTESEARWVEEHAAALADMVAEAQRTGAATTVTERGLRDVARVPSQVLENVQEERLLCPDDGEAHAMRLLADAVRCTMRAPAGCEAALGDSALRPRNVFI